MKKVFLLLLASLLWQFTNAQKCSKIDYDAIYKETQNPQSKFYIKKLLERYQNLDTTLTLEDYKHLYYGYTKTEYYSPMQVKSTELRKKVLEKNIDEAKKLADTLDKKNPVNLNLLYSKSILAMYEKDREKGVKYATLLQGLITTILSSGDAQSSETALVITAVEDEYFILMLLQLNYQGVATTDCCDIFDIKTNSGETKKFYFNKEKSSEYILKMFSEKLTDTTSEDKTEKKKKK